MAHARRTPWVRYGLALAAVLSGIASSIHFEGAGGRGPQVLPLVLTVLLIGRFAGSPAALGATALVAAFVLFFPAPLSIEAHAPAALHGGFSFGLLLLIGLLGIEYSRSLDRARRRARSIQERAREEARERMAAEEGLVEVAGENLFLEERAAELEKASQRASNTMALVNTLLMNAPVGFCLLDRRFRYLRVNQALALMSSLPRSDHFGRTVEQVLPRLWPTLSPILQRVLEHEEPVVGVEVCDQPDGDPARARHWLTSYYPVRTRNRVLFGIGMAVSEITEQKRLETELKKRAEELAENDRRKDEFLAMLAHELRNPLHPIMAAVQVMRLRQAPASGMEEERDVIERQVRNLAKLIDDLLDVSRITRGKIHLQQERLLLGAVIKRALEAARPLLDARYHRLHISLPREPIMVLGDGTRLEQILCNLLQNAAKYTQPGGQVWLTAELEGTEVVVRVRDTGIGISPDMRGRIFDPFVQADRSLDRAQGGLGIGLTLVRRLVEMHGGRVEAISEGPGCGSEFVVRLPALCEAPAAALKNGVEPRKPLDRQLRVLVVDDNADAARFLSILLAGQGHVCRTANDGRSALETAAVFEPEVVFMDIGLPGMDGYEVARRLREQPGTRNCLLVALTGYGRDEDRRRSSEAGFDHHLVKPVGYESLEAFLVSREECLGGQPAG